MFARKCMKLFCPYTKHRFKCVILQRYKKIKLLPRETTSLTFIEYKFPFFISDKNALSALKNDASCGYKNKGK